MYAPLILGTAALYMVPMGIGGLVGLGYIMGLYGTRALRWFPLGFRQVFYQWRVQWGFERLELLEALIAELRGERRSKNMVDNTIDDEVTTLSNRAGCLTILVFLPWHFTITPVGLMVRRHRRRVLTEKIRELPFSVQERIPIGERKWLHITR